jgi:hypothetical protein
VKPPVSPVLVSVSSVGGSVTVLTVVVDVDELSVLDVVVSVLVELVVEDVVEVVVGSVVVVVVVLVVDVSSFPLPPASAMTAINRPITSATTRPIANFWPLLIPPRSS